MKIICQKSDLQKSVNISLRAVPVRSTMPILECILIDASSNTIRMISNDTDMGIETILRGDVVDKGIIAINAKMFAEVVRKLPDSEVTIETDYNMNVVFFCLPIFRSSNATSRSKSLSSHSGRSFPRRFFPLRPMKTISS